MATVKGDPPSKPGERSGQHSNRGDGRAVSFGLSRVTSSPASSPPSKAAPSGSPAAPSRSPAERGTGIKSFGDEPAGGAPLCRPRSFEDKWQVGRTRRQGLHFVSNVMAPPEQARIPDSVLEDMTLVCDGQVVQGFRYSEDEKPEIEYDPVHCCGIYYGSGMEERKKRRKTGEVDNRPYARLVTKNMLYNDLWSTICGVAIDLTDEYSHIAFIGVLCHDSGLDEYTRSTFVTVFLLCQLVLIVLAVDRTRIAWKMDLLEKEGGKSASRGDMIISSKDRNIDQHGEADVFSDCPCWCRCCCGCELRFLRWLWRYPCFKVPKGRGRQNGYQRLAWYFQFRLFMQLFFFEYFGIRKHVQELVVQVHPMHAKQPWIAFRKDEARCFLIGYRDKTMFRYEDNAGMEHSIPVHCVIKIILLTMKIRTFSKLSDFGSIAMLTIAPSIPSLYLKWLKWRVVSKDRIAFKAWLKKARSENPDEVLDRMWHRHFGEDRVAYKVKTVRRGALRFFSWRRWSSRKDDANAHLLSV